MLKRFGRFALLGVLVSSSACGGGEYDMHPISDITSLSIAGKVARGAARRTFTDEDHIRKVEHLLNGSRNGWTWSKLKPGFLYLLEVRFHAKDGSNGRIFIDNDAIYADQDYPAIESETNSDPNDILHLPFSRTQRLAWCSALETHGCDY